MMEKIEKPTANKGRVDVSRWDFSKQGNLRLDGQWEFYWNELLKPGQFSSFDNKKAYLQVPSNWNNVKLNHQVLSGEGVGTYKLNIRFSRSELFSKKALLIMNVYTAYRVWIDGELVDEKGLVGTSRDTSELDFNYEVVEFTPTTYSTEVVIQVSNFDHYKGGITNEITLGNEPAINRNLAVRQGFEGFIIGGLVLMGVYHLALYTTRRDDSSPLYFGLFCLIFALYSFFGSTYDFVLTLLMDWSIILKIEYITVYVIPLIFLLYVNTLYPKEISKIAIWASFGLFFVYTMITLVTPTFIFTRLMPSYNLILMVAMVYLLYVFILALRRRRIGTRLILVMFFIFVLTSIHDIFFYSYQIPINMKIAPLGFLFFIGAHSYVLALRFARAFHKIEDLTNEIENTQKEIIYTLGEIAEVRSKETGNHVKRVAEYARLLADKYGLSQKEINLIKLASPMHDVGKVGIPDSILSKPGKLTYEEYELMKTHSQIGYEMLKHSNRDILQCAAEIALTHHERWDGKGYPYGLKGEEIPISGRITAVADVFDALGSDRVYKKAWSTEETLNYFRRERGGHFDPKIVDILLENVPKLLEIKGQYTDKQFS